MGIQTVSQRAALVAADVESVARFLKAVQRHVDCWLHLYNVAPVTTLPLDFDWGAQLVHCAENTILADCPLRVLALGKDQADLVMLDMATQRRIVWALPLQRFAHSVMLTHSASWPRRNVSKPVCLARGAQRPLGRPSWR